MFAIIGTNALLLVSVVVNNNVPHLNISENRLFLRPNEMQTQI